MFNSDKQNFYYDTYYVNIRKYYYFLRKLLGCDCAPLYITRSRLTKNLLQNGTYAKSESHIEGGQNRKYNSSTRDNTIVVYRYGDGWNLEIVTIICTPRGMKNAKNFSQKFYLYNNRTSLPPQRTRHLLFVSTKVISFTTRVFHNMQYTPI